MVGEGTPDSSLSRDRPRRGDGRQDDTSLAVPASVVPYSQSGPAYGHQLHDEAESLVKQSYTLSSR